MATNGICVKKSLAFAIRIVNLRKYLTEKHFEFVLSKQLLRSGTAIGALVREAEHAESKRDFLHKMNIALKEANETEYWLMLLYKSKYLNDIAYRSIIEDCREVLKLLISIVKSTKENISASKL